MINFFISYFLLQHSVREHDIEEFLLGMASQVTEREDNIITEDLQSKLTSVHLITVLDGLEHLRIDLSKWQQSPYLNRTNFDIHYEQLWTKLMIIASRWLNG